MKNRNLPFVLFTIAFCIILVLPNLMKDGMFLDGVLYASVAHNLAIGKGTFWYPFFSDTSMPFFHEQPPLTFGIMSLFYRVLGDSIYVDRFYSFLMMCLQALLIRLVWKEVYKNQKDIAALYWIPIALWILIPVCHWCFSNGLEENTMGVFTLLSIYVIWKGLENTSAKSFLYFFSAGLLLFIASLCKGFPGLFPLAAIGIYWLVFKSFALSKAIAYTLTLVAGVALGYGLVLSNAYTRTSWLTYLNERVLNSIKNVSSGDGRFHIWEELTLNLLISVALTGIVLLIARIRKEPLSVNLFKKNNLFFLLLGMSGSLPLIVTLEQRGFYTACTLPCYAITLAGITAPVCSNWINRINTGKKGFRYACMVSVLLVPITLVYSGMQFGKFSRDKEKLHDIYTIGKVIPAFSTIDIKDDMCLDWGLQCYLVRYLSINSICGMSQHYYLVDKASAQPGNDYTLVKLPTAKYNLYSRK